MTVNYNARQAEEAVVGAVLRDSSILDEVLPILDVNDFTNYGPMAVFAAAAHLHANGKPADLVTVADELHARGKIDDVGGYTALAQLYEAVVTTGNAVHYAQIVRDGSVLRQIALVGAEMARDATEGADSAQHLLESAEQRILAIAERTVSGQVVKLGAAVAETLERIDRRSAVGADERAVPTGLAALDQWLCGGFHPGELVVLAARPGRGKTALAGHVAAHAASNGFPVFFASLEQSRHELSERQLSASSGIPGVQIRAAKLDQWTVAQLLQARDSLADLPLYIDDSAIQGTLRIAANARRLKRREGVRLVIVDYLQLVAPDNRREPRHEQVAGISRRLKQLARETNLPVLALAQLNRASEERQDKRPKLADLRESGGIEADADVVLLLHRTEEKNSDRLEILIAKQRNGPTGEVPVRFNPELMRVEDLADEAKRVF